MWSLGPTAAHLRAEQRRDVFQAVAVVVCTAKLQDDELPSLWDGQVHTETESGSG